MGKVILTVGVPGCGKSTWIKSQINNTPYVICSADHYFEKGGKYIYDPKKIGLAHSSCFEKFVNALKNEIPLIFIDNTNIIKEHRAAYINKAKEYDYDIEVKVFPIDLEHIKLQNKSSERIMAGKIVPDTVIDSMAAKLDIAPGTYIYKDDKLVKILETNLFIKNTKLSELHAQVVKPPAEYQKPSSLIEYDEYLLDLELRNSLPKGFLHYMIEIESSGNQFAVSPKGAKGFFQIMPKEISGFLGNPFDPKASAKFAAEEMAKLVKHFGTYKEALAAYNWGRTNLITKGFRHAPKETLDYVDKFKNKGVPMGKVSNSVNDVNIFSKNH